MTERPMVSVVIPCLNEADTITICVRKAKEGIAASGLPGEVVVADNGSADGSERLAAAEGARVVHVPHRGYGHALMHGIRAASGDYVVMGDADASYDFGFVPQLVAPLRAGVDLVQGCRLPSGGGTIADGAMPWSHRHIGNPFFSLLARRWFRAPIHDVYCGLRAFRRDFWLGLDQRCTGMEFATEMILKASLAGAKIAEIPITLHKDGRKTSTKHLRTVRDGWRTLRFFLLCAPRQLFFLPGLMLIALAALGYGLALPGARVLGAHLDAHTLLVASMAALVGYQALWFSLLAKAFAVSEGLLPDDGSTARWERLLPLERGLLLGGLAAILGLVLIGVPAMRWAQGGFGDLDYPVTMRAVVPGTTLVALAAQTVFSSFLYSMLSLRRVTQRAA